MYTIKIYCTTRFSRRFVLMDTQSIDIYIADSPRILRLIALAERGTSESVSQSILAQ